MPGISIAIALTWHLLSRFVLYNLQISIIGMKMFIFPRLNVYCMLFSCIYLKVKSGLNKCFWVPCCCQQLFVEWPSLLTSSPLDIMRQELFLSHLWYFLLSVYTNKNFSFCHWTVSNLIYTPVNTALMILGMQSLTCNLAGTRMSSVIAAVVW